jgi:predicted amidohydrolase
MPRVPVRIACAQFRATHSPGANLAACTRLAALAARGGARALFLPEASDYISRSASETLDLMSSPETAAFVPGLKSLARQHSLAIIAGIHTPSSSPERVRNTCVYITPSGDLEHSYNKLHLFDIALPTVTLRESDTTEPGRQLLEPFETPFGRLGLQICFDLRFPEPARWLVNRGAQVLTYPSAFTVPTGRAHWELLLRARAVEGQCWVVAPAQMGSHNEKRRSWGEALVVDPWGTVVGRCRSVDNVGESGLEGEEGETLEEVCFADVDLGMVERVRRECPLRRRNDVYGEL